MGEQIEPGGRPKAPGRLELLQRFVNTWNHDFPTEWDRIGTPGKAHGWLVAKRLIERDDVVRSSDVERLRVFREAIRSLAIAHHDDEPAPRGVVRALEVEAARTRLVVTLSSDGSAALHGAGIGVDRAVGELLATLHDAQMGGTWRRMKACRQCEYVFFDRSKNRSAAWCAMAICGNRTKNRVYRRRRASATT